jgi:hypothetical protein
MAAQTGSAQSDIRAKDCTFEFMGLLLASMAAKTIAGRWLDMSCAFQAISPGPQ